MKIAFGVDLGGTTVKLAAFDALGEMLHKWEIPTVTAGGGQQILPDIAAAVKGYLQKNSISPEDVIGIGIGVPGPVQPDGVVNKCVNLGWGVFNIEKALRELTGFTVKAGNDASVAALGESRMGGEDCRNMVFVTLGTGVGGGIVIDGKLLYGTHGAGGEIGHMVMDPMETEPCSCGKYGCLEQYGSATGIVRVAKKHLKEGEMPSALRDREKLTCKDVFDAAKAEDLLAQKILEEVFAYLGAAIANVCNAVDPDAVVIGGGVSKAGDLLLEGVQRHFQRHVFHAVGPVQFRLAQLGNDAGVYGAFWLLSDR